MNRSMSVANLKFHWEAAKGETSHQIPTFDKGPDVIFKTGGELVPFHPGRKQTDKKKSLLVPREEG